MINKELARIQAELKAPKDLGEDESIKFKYRNCEQMFAQLKPLFNGLTERWYQTNDTGVKQNIRTGNSKAFKQRRHTASVGKGARGHEVYERNRRWM